jgi:putative SOS response-associated peptidase YedK
MIDRYYEWLKKGKEKLPFLTRTKGGERLMLLAGLYDSVILEGKFPEYRTLLIECDHGVCRQHRTSLDLHDCDYRC